MGIPRGMDLCLTLLLLTPRLSVFANGNSFSRTNATPSDVRLPRVRNWFWNPSELSKNAEFTEKIKGGCKTGEEQEFEKAVKAISSLEISKSIELVFDPKIQALIPTIQIPRKNERNQKKAHDSAIVLLSPKTYTKLKKVFENLKREGESGENAPKNLKNFQTGRFKSKNFKTIQGFTF